MRRSFGAPVPLDSGDTAQSLRREIVRELRAERDWLREQIAQQNQPTVSPREQRDAQFKALAARNPRRPGERWDNWFRRLRSYENDD